MLLKVAERFFYSQAGIEDDAYEAVYAHANHNKRLPSKVVDYLKHCLRSGEGPSWVVPGSGKAYRGDVNDQPKIESDIQTKLTEREGRQRVTINLTPGSSWSYDYGQAEYHSTSGSLNPQTEILYTASTSSGDWFDLKELYKTSQFRGLRLEREVVGLNSQIPCEAKWKLP